MPYVSVGIFLTWGKHLHDRITSIRENVSAHKTSLKPLLVMELPVPRLNSERSCIYVLEVSILPLSTNLIFEFGLVPTVWYVLHFILMYK